MSKDKQIEDMKQIIYENTEFDTMWDEIEASAKSLYNAGYRKTFTSELASDTQKAFKEGYVKARSEVAREIFEEIEYLIWQNDTHPASELTEHIAELKKKYTEDKK